jgi:hypothetical protein
VQAAWGWAVAGQQAQRHHHWSGIATILIRCMRASLLLDLLLGSFSSSSNVPTSLLQGREVDEVGARGVRGQWRHSSPRARRSVDPAAALVVDGPFFSRRALFFSRGSPERGSKDGGGVRGRTPFFSCGSLETDAL